MGYYCSFCKRSISEAEKEYSLKHYGKYLCYAHQKTEKQFHKSPSTNYQKSASYSKTTNSKITPQAKKLSEALKRRGIKHKLEDYDGYKHVDISIPWANLNIEIDGKQHSLSAKQFYADLERGTYSAEDGIATKRFTNEDIDRYVEQIAGAIAKVAKKRYREESDSLF
jgi:very-short-patch-repair endonuclease